MATSKNAKNTVKTSETKKTVAKENQTIEEKTEKAVVKENLTTEKKAENTAPKTETVIENNGLEQTVKEVKAETKSENNSVDFDAKTYTIVNPAKANKKVLGSRGQLIEFDATGAAKVDFIEAKRYATIPGYTVKE